MKKNILILIAIILIIFCTYLSFRYLSYKNALAKTFSGIPAADCERNMAEKGFIYFIQKSNLCDIMN